MTGTREGNQFRVFIKSAINHCEPSIAVVDWNSLPLGQQVLKILPQNHSTQRARELGYLCTKGFTAPGETLSRILCLQSSTVGSGNIKANCGKGRLGLQWEVGQVNRVVRLRGC